MTRRSEKKNKRVVPIFSYSKFMIHETFLSAGLISQQKLHMKLLVRNILIRTFDFTSKGENNYGEDVT